MLLQIMLRTFFVRYNDSSLAFKSHLERPCSAELTCLQLRLPGEETAFSKGHARQDKWALLWVKAI